MPLPLAALYVSSIHSLDTSMDSLQHIQKCLGSPCHSYCSQIWNIPNMYHLADQSICMKRQGGNWKSLNTCHCFDNFLSFSSCLDCPCNVHSKVIYSKTCLNQTPLGLEKLFSLERCLVYRGIFHCVYGHGTENCSAWTVFQFRQCSDQTGLTVPYFHICWFTSLPLSPPFPVMWAHLMQENNWNKPFHMDNGG